MHQAILISTKSESHSTVTYNITLSENLPVGTVVGSVFAPDADVGSNGDAHLRS